MVFEFVAKRASLGTHHDRFMPREFNGRRSKFRNVIIQLTGQNRSEFRFTEDHRRELILIAHCFNQKALDFEPDRQPEQAQALSPREVDALTLLAMGYSRAQVSETLAISQHTLRVYIESARFKLGAQNTVHAVARAQSRGLIVV